MLSTQDLIFLTKMHDNLKTTLQPIKRYHKVSVLDVTHRYLAKLVGQEMPFASFETPI